MTRSAGASALLDAPQVKTDKSVRVTYGAHDQVYQVAGLTVGQIRTQLRDAVNPPPDAKALIDGHPVGDRHVVDKNQQLEFVKRAGQNG